MAHTTTPATLDARGKIEREEEESDAGYETSRSEHVERSNVVGDDIGQESTENGGAVDLGRSE